MEPIHIFVWKEDGLTQAITDTAMLTQLVLSDPDDPKSKLVTMCSVVDSPGLKKEAKARKCFDGEWHVVNFKSEVTRADRLKAEQSLYKVNEAGMYVYEVWREQDAFAIHVISSWDFKDPYAKDPNTIIPVSEEGWGRLADSVASIIVGVAWRRFKGNPKTFRFPG